MKTIHSSNLMLRFYVSEGWTKEELDECCSRGEVHIAHPHDRDPYFTLKTGGYFDVAELLKRYSSLVRAFNDYPWESDLQFMERHNG